jgi:hypothetical protein
MEFGGEGFCFDIEKCAAHIGLLARVSLALLFGVGIGYRFWACSYQLRVMFEQA